MRSHMLTIEFTEIVHLPRFTMKEGERWRARSEKINGQDLKLGGGIVKPSQFKVIL